MFSIEEIAKEMEMTRPGVAQRNLTRTIVANVLCDAAAQVESHWNDAATVTNQKAQAARSADVLRSLARDISSKNETIL
jgi:hypothetical protein